MVSGGFRVFSLQCLESVSLAFIPSVLFYLDHRVFSPEPPRSTVPLIGFLLSCPSTPPQAFFLHARHAFPSNTLSRPEVKTYLAEATLLFSIPQIQEYFFSLLLSKKRLKGMRYLLRNPSTGFDYPLDVFYSCIPDRLFQRSTLVSFSLQSFSHLQGSKNRFQFFLRSCTSQ